MSKYICPSCDGGFPEPLDKECPWCGQDMNKSYTEGPEIGIEQGVGNMIGSSGRPETGLDIDQSPPGMTPCPECGEDMPMVSWNGPKPKCRKCAANDRRNNIGGNHS